MEEGEHRLAPSHLGGHRPAPSDPHTPTSRAGLGLLLGWCLFLRRLRVVDGLLLSLYPSPLPNLWRGSGVVGSAWLLSALPAVRGERNGAGTVMTGAGVDSRVRVHRDGHPGRGGGFDMTTTREPAIAGGGDPPSETPRRSAPPGASSPLLWPSNRRRVSVAEGRLRRGKDMGRTTTNLPPMARTRVCGMDNPGWIPSS
jgi:hypothetical protein